LAGFELEINLGGSVVVVEADERRADCGFIDPLACRLD
jgi:hypothetical protein